MRPQFPALSVFAALALASPSIADEKSVAEHFQPGVRNVSLIRGSDHSNVILRPNQNVFRRGETNLVHSVTAAKKLPVSRRPVSSHPQLIKSTPLSGSGKSSILKKTIRIKSPASSLFRRR